MFCTNCGSREADGMRFCSQCGTTLLIAAQPARTVNANPARSGGYAPARQGVVMASRGQTSARTRMNPLTLPGVALAVAVALIFNLFLGSALAGALGLSSKSGVLTASDVTSILPNTGDKPVEALKSAVTQASIPDKWFSYPSVKGYALINLDLESIDIELPDANPKSKWMSMTPYSNGYAVGIWDAIDYDEEWDVVRSELVHIGLFDTRGELVKDLTPSVLELGIEQETLNEIGNIHDDLWALTHFPGVYKEGRLVLNLPASSDETLGDDEAFRDVIVFNERGDVVFSRKNVRLDASYYYRDGVLGLVTYDDRAQFVKSELLGVDGEELASSTEYSLTSYGYGYYQIGRDFTKVYAYDGSVVLDTASFATDDILSPQLIDPESVRESYYNQYTSSGKGQGGLIKVYAMLKNPYGGEDKNVAGLYNLNTHEWVVPFSAGFYKSGFQWNEGIALVQVGGDNDNAKWCFMNRNGSSLIDSVVAQNTLGIPHLENADYLGDGFWLCWTDKKDSATLLYFADEEYKGAKEVYFGNSDLSFSWENTKLSIS